MLEYQTFSML